MIGFFRWLCSETAIASMFRGAAAAFICHCKWKSPHQLNSKLNAIVKCEWVCALYAGLAYTLSEMASTLKNNWLSIGESKWKWLQLWLINREALYLLLWKSITHHITAYMLSLIIKLMYDCNQQALSLSASSLSYFFTSGRCICSFKFLIELNTYIFLTNQ